MSSISSLSGANTSLAQLQQLLSNGASPASNSVSSATQQLLQDVEGNSGTAGFSTEGSSSGQSLAQQLEASIISAVEGQGSPTSDSSGTSSSSNSSLLQSIYNNVSQTLQANGVDLSQTASSSQSSSVKNPGSTSQLQSMLSSIIQSSANQSVAQALLGGLSPADSSNLGASSLVQLLQNTPAGTALNVSG